jgi:hypothetical protein
VRLRLLVLGLLTPLVLAACGGDPPTTPTKDPGPLTTASSPSPRPSSASSPACSLLTPVERKLIAGDDLDAVLPSPTLKGTFQCRWVKSLKEPTTTLLQVVVTSAQEWTKTVPQQVDGALATGRSKTMLKRLLAARKKVQRGVDSISDKQACAMFALMAEASGRKPGTKEIVSFPMYRSQLSVTASSCRKGRYISVMYTQSNLMPSPPLNAAITRLLHAAEQRAADRA